MHCRTLLSLLSTLVFLSLSVADSEAQTARTIRVSGGGAVSASPNQATVRGTLTAGDEDVEKTAKKFAEVKDAFIKIIGGDTHPEVVVEFAGEKLSTGGAGFDGAVVAPPVADFGGPVELPVEIQQFSMSEEVVLRVAISSDMERQGITKKLGGLINAASKAGLSLGGSPNAMLAAMGMGAPTGLVQFELDEKGQAALRKRAYTAAFNDARARASALAELSGGRLGKVVSVEESASPQGSNDLESMQIVMLRRMFGGGVGAADGGIDHNGRIERQQELVVTFELVE